MLSPNWLHNWADLLKMALINTYARLCAHIQISNISAIKLVCVLVCNGYLSTHWPALVAVWSEALPLTASCLSPLSGSHLGYAVDPRH